MGVNEKDRGEELKIRESAAGKTEHLKKRNQPPAVHIHGRRLISHNRPGLKCYRITFRMQE